VQGEIRYLREARRDPGRELLDIPIEWTSQGDADASLARNALNALVRDSLGGRGWKRPDEKLRAFWRWAASALFGDLGARTAAHLAAAHARAVLTALKRVGSSHTFRWSEPQAAVRIKGEPGHNTVRLRSPALRAPLDRIGTHFYLDGAPIDPEAIVTGCDSYTLSVDFPPTGIATLAWSCPVLRGLGDSRRLGLSIVAIDVGQDIPQAECAARE
jgi:hypothetical protein